MVSQSLSLICFTSPRSRVSPFLLSRYAFQASSEDADRGTATSAAASTRDISNPFFMTAPPRGSTGELATAFGAKPLGLRTVAADQVALLGALAALNDLAGREPLLGRDDPDLADLLVLGADHLLGVRVHDVGAPRDQRQDHALVQARGGAGGDGDRAIRDVGHRADPGGRPHRGGRVVGRLVGAGLHRVGDRGLLLGLSLERAADRPQAKAGHAGEPGGGAGSVEHLVGY